MSIPTNGNGNGRYYLKPRVLQISGLVLLIGSCIFWMLTDRQSAIFIGAALSLIGVGAYASVVNGVRQVTGAPPAPSIETAGAEPSA